MSYLQPAEFVKKMVDSGESKIYMGRRDTIIRGYMAGAILALAVVFAVTITVNTGNALLGAALFPVGFCMLYLMSFDLLTGVFMLTPLAWLDGRPGVTIPRILENWGLVFIGNLLGAPWPSSWRSISPTASPVRSTRSAKPSPISARGARSAIATTASAAG